MDWDVVSECFLKEGFEPIGETGWLRRERAAQFEHDGLGDSMNKEAGWLKRPHTLSSLTPRWRGRSLSGRHPPKIP